MIHASARINKLLSQFENNENANLVVTDWHFLANQTNSNCRILAFLLEELSFFIKFHIYGNIYIVPYNLISILNLEYGQ